MLNKVVLNSGQTSLQSVQVIMACGFIKVASICSRLRGPYSLNWSVIASCIFIILCLSSWKSVKFMNQTNDDQKVTRSVWHFLCFLDLDRRFVACGTVSSTTDVCFPSRPWLRTVFSSLHSNICRGWCAAVQSYLWYCNCHQRRFCNILVQTEIPHEIQTQSTWIS